MSPYSYLKLIHLPPSARIKKFSFLIFLAAILFIVSLTMGILQQFDTYNTIMKNKKVTVLTLNSPTTYYEGRDGPMGFEYDLVGAFASSLEIGVEFKKLDSVAEILEAIENGEGDIAAASLARTVERRERFTFGPSYLLIQQQVVCRRGKSVPRSLKDLPEYDFLLIDQSSYVERLETLKTFMPNIHWETTRDLSIEQILEKVWRGEVECTIANSNVVALNKRYFPELRVAFSLGAKEHVAWILKDNSRRLLYVVKDWFRKFEKQGNFETLFRQYYDHVKVFDYVDLAIFHRHIQERLPKYQSIFEQASEKYGIPWIILAAQAYQESHWNPKAISPTGVRGIMMLTRRTAKSLGIKNRNNPRQSIMGGAKYLSRLLKRIPESVLYTDRLRYALAAYNVGMGHIYDARTLAKQLGKNPDKWNELLTVLPLLSQKKHYRNLKYGYARGTEPVRYVKRIYNYLDILEHQDNVK